MLSVLRPSFFKSSSDCAQTAVVPDRTAAATSILMAPPLRARTCYARRRAYRNAASARLKSNAGHGGEVAAALKQFLAAPDYPEDAGRSAQARLFNVVALTALAALVAAVTIQLALGQSGLPMLFTTGALAVTALM